MRYIFGAQRGATWFLLYCVHHNPFRLIYWILYSVFVCEGLLARVPAFISYFINIIDLHSDNSKIYLALTLIYFFDLMKLCGISDLW